MKESDGIMSHHTYCVLVRTRAGASTIPSLLRAKKCRQIKCWSIISIQIWISNLDHHINFIFFFEKISTVFVTVLVLEPIRPSSTGRLELAKKYILYNQQLALLLILPLACSWVHRDAREWTQLSLTAEIAFVQVLLFKIVCLMHLSWRCRQVRWRRPYRLLMYNFEQSIRFNVY